MNTVKQVMAELKKKGNEKTHQTYCRHGAPADKLFGVQVGDMKVILKKIKGNQELALELYETGNSDAQYLAGLAADGALMTKQQLESWAKTACWGMISQWTVPFVAAESKHASSLAAKWIKSKKESIAVSGWGTLSSMVAVVPDESLDLDELKAYMDKVLKEVHSASNEVKGMMNAYIIAVGTYVKPLLKQAKATAKKMGKVEVDHGDTSCKTPDALSYIEKVEQKGRVGKKRKSTKC